MDEQPKSRRPRPAWGDDQRASIGKARRTPPHGYPVHIDPELTPPPQVPPIAGDVHQQLRLLADGLGDLTVAVGKVWDERGNGERIDRLEAAVTGYTTTVARHQETLDGLLVPSVKSLLASSDSLRVGYAETNTQLEQFFEREWPRHEQLMERFGKALDDIAQRITRLEGAVEKQSSRADAIESRLEATAKMQNAMDVRLTAVERKIDDTALVRTAAEGERRRILTWGRAALLGAGGAIAAIAEQLLG